jgi:aspartate 1-decarboxylase
MLVKLLKAKLHMATVTETHLSYSGSLTIDQDLMDAVGLLDHESVMFGNFATGDRAETYAIAGPRGSGQIHLNGAAARLGSPGDKLVILAFGWMDSADAEMHKPKVAVLGEANKIVEMIE